MQSIEAAVEQRKHTYCIPINVTKCGLSRKDAKLRDAINAAQFVIADGIPMVWLGRRFGCHNVHRVTRIELAEQLMARAAEKDWRIFFLGASQDNLAAAITNLGVRFADLQVAGARNGYFTKTPFILQRAGLEWLYRSCYDFRKGLTY